MRELDPTKEYYLGGLSDKQLKELVEYLSKENNASIFYHQDFSIIKKHIKNNNKLATNKDFNSWGLYPKDYWGREVVDALELFEPQLKIGNTFEYNGFVCRVESKVLVWVYNKMLESYHKECDIQEHHLVITNKEFIKQLEENVR